MRTLFEEAAKLQSVLDDEGWEFFFVGGIAVQIWGEPRLTTDIDLTIFTGLVNEDERIARLLTLIKPRDAGVEEAAEFSKTARILLLRSSGGLDIDMMLSGVSDLGEEYARSSFQRFTPELSLRVCSAETLIGMKTYAGRSRDIADLETVLIKQTQLDWDYINRYLNEILEYEEISEKISILETLKDKHYRP
jgi:hypothetical protein